MSEAQKGEIGEAQHRPRLEWDHGTAYDLFVSLEVLHNPGFFGLRASWAAGVRSRLSIEERRVLEDADKAIGIPFHWIYTLPEPKNGASALWALRQLAPEERLPTLALTSHTSERTRDVLERISERGIWDEDDQQAIRTVFFHKKGDRASSKDVEAVLKLWVDPAGFGEDYLSALQTYYQAFFTEEERHIAPILQDALKKAQDLSQNLPLEDLLERLSQGLHFPSLIDLPKWVFAPSYWITPLVVAEKLTSDSALMIFGARPPTESVVPGEVVPDALLRAFKAIADPTRLRILQYLVHEQLTPTEITRRLRLRAPTVSHHLNALRLAGLVHLTLESHAERRYTARLEAIQEIFSLLNEFLAGEEMD
jgi:DNA-binding transcriptional ArsR family regulator